MPPTTAHRGTNIHDQLRPRKSRCKTGCLCCRLRKKKCDETRPVCANCTRHGVICSWPRSDEFAWRQRMGLSSSDADTSSSLERKTSPPHQKESDPGKKRELEKSLSGELCPRTPKIGPSLSYSLPTNGLATPSYSSRLLQTYAQHIAPYFSCAPNDFKNPYIRDVLPIAFSDGLVMNAVLAVGGSTLDVQHPVCREGEQEVLQCYGQAIKELKLGLTEWAAGTQEQWGVIRLFLTVMLLCHYEIIRGNKKGYLFHHIRASRFFAPIVSAYKGDQWSSLVGVLLENYAYFELCSSLRLTPDQIDITAASQIVVPQLDNLRRFDTFGSMFGGASEIYKYVPDICELALRRKAELANGQNLQCEQTFEHLKAAITQWEGVGYDSCGNNMFGQGSIAAGIVTQNALFLFLMSAYLQDQNQEYLREISQPLVDSMIEMLPILGATRFTNTSFWPVIVTASYATTHAQQKIITEFFPPFMPLITRAMEVLQWIWEGPESIFGLLGMAKVIELHSTSYCFG